MAVNTETKRRSVAGMVIMALVIAPVPNATIGRADRGHVLGIYLGGIATDAVHIRSTGEIEPNHVSDSGNNLLLAGEIESQGGGYFGDSANYAKFAADGELTLAGTARVIKHLHFSMELGKGQSAPTERYTEDPYVSYTYATNDDSHISREAPDDMDYTVDSIIKVHWYTTDATADGVDEIRWAVQWASRAPGEDITLGDTPDNSGDIVCSAQNIIVETAVETIPANSIAAGDMVGIHFERVAIGDGTNPTVGTVHAISVELEYTANKLGEAT